MAIRVCVAGVTGWTGSMIAKAILSSSEFELTGAIARKSVGADVGETLGQKALGLRIVSTLEESLSRPVDVLIDFTEPTSVKARVLAALRHGTRVVIGTSGLTSNDYADIESEAIAGSLGVIAAGNFSITAALAKHFSLLAAQYLPAWEIIDYAHAGKSDVPSGTTRELAEQLATIAPCRIGYPISELHGPKEARGAQVEGTPVHSIRLPSYTIAFETLFGLPDERLTIRHDSGTGAEPYVAGTLLAAKKVLEVRGLIRGLDALLF